MKNKRKLSDSELMLNTLNHCVNLGKPNAPIIEDYVCWKMDKYNKWVFIFVDGELNPIYVMDMLKNNKPSMDYIMEGCDVIDKSLLVRGTTGGTAVDTLEVHTHVSLLPDLPKEFIGVIVSNVQLLS